MAADEAVVEVEHVGDDVLFGPLEDALLRPLLHQQLDLLDADRRLRRAVHTQQREHEVGRRREQVDQRAADRGQRRHWFGHQ